MTTCSKRKHGGEACRGPAVRGSDPAACRFHLGKRASEVIAEHELRQSAKRLMQTTEWVDVSNVLETHLALASEAATWLAVLRGHVSQEESVGYRHRTGEQVRATVRVYTEAIASLNRILTDIGRLDVERRLVDVSREHSERMAAILALVLTGYGLAFTDEAVRAAVQDAIGKTAPRRPALPGGRPA